MYKIIACFLSIILFSELSSAAGKTKKSDKKPCPTLEEISKKTNYWDDLGFKASQRLLKNCPELKSSFEASNLNLSKSNLLRKGRLNPSKSN